MNVEQRLAALEAAVAELQAQRTLDTADVFALTDLLPQIFAAYPEQTFCANELDVIPNIEDFGSTRSVGRLLQRCAGVPINGFRIERVAPSREGTIWRVSHI